MFSAARALSPSSSCHSAKAALLLETSLPLEATMKSKRSSGLRATLPRSARSWPFRLIFRPPSARTRIGHGQASRSGRTACRLRSVITSRTKAGSMPCSSAEAHTAAATCGPARKKCSHDSSRASPKPAASSLRPVAASAFAKAPSARARCAKHQAYCACEPLAARPARSKKGTASRYAADAISTWPSCITVTPIQRSGRRLSLPRRSASRACVRAGRRRPSSKSRRERSRCHQLAGRGARGCSKGSARANAARPASAWPRPSAICASSNNSLSSIAGSGARSASARRARKASARAGAWHS